MGYNGVSPAAELQWCLSHEQAVPALESRTDLPLRPLPSGLAAREPSGLLLARRGRTDGPVRPPPALPGSGTRPTTLPPPHDAHPVAVRLRHRHLLLPATDE